MTTTTGRAEGVRGAALDAEKSAAGVAATHLGHAVATKTWLRPWIRVAASIQPREDRGPWLAHVMTTLAQSTSRLAFLLSQVPEGANRPRMHRMHDRWSGKAETARPFGHRRHPAISPSPVCIAGQTNQKRYSLPPSLKTTSSRKSPRAKEWQCGSTHERRETCGPIPTRPANTGMCASFFA